MMVDVVDIGEEPAASLASRFRQMAVDAAGQWGNRDASSVTWVATEGRLVRRVFEHTWIEDGRRLYVLVVSGGEYVLRKTGPGGQPILPFGKLAIFVDGDTLKPFMFSGGVEAIPSDLSVLGDMNVESLAGVSPTPDDQDAKTEGHRAAAADRRAGALGGVADLVVALSRAARPNRLPRGRPVRDHLARFALGLPSLPNRAIRGLPRTSRRLVTGRAVRDFSSRTAVELGALRRSR